MQRALQEYQMEGSGWVISSGQYYSENLYSEAGGCSAEYRWWWGKNTFLKQPPVNNFCFSPGDDWGLRQLSCFAPGLMWRCPPVPSVWIPTIKCRSLVRHRGQVGVSLLVVAAVQDHGHLIKKTLTPPSILVNKGKCNTKAVSGERYWR